MLHDHALDGLVIREGALVLADGSVFEGELFGAEPPDGIASGEVVFNTVLSGYQEVPLTISTGTPAGTLVGVEGVL